LIVQARANTYSWAFVRFKFGQAVKILRKFIREIINLDRPVDPSAYGENHVGAGIIVLKNFNSDWKILVLLADDGYDFPKGTAEPGESTLDTALRETQEECGVSELDFQWGMDAIDLDGLSMFLAATTQEPRVRPNPESGILEHLGAEWMDWATAANGIYLYLLPAIIWAKRRVEERSQ